MNRVHGLHLIVLTSLCCVALSAGEGDRRSVLWRGGSIAVEDAADSVLVSPSGTSRAASTRWRPTPTRSPSGSPRPPTPPSRGRQPRHPRERRLLARRAPQGRLAGAAGLRRPRRVEHQHQRHAGRPRPAPRHRQPRRLRRRRQPAVAELRLAHGHAPAGAARDAVQAARVRRGEGLPVLRLLQVLLRQQQHPQPDVRRTGDQQQLLAGPLQEVVGQQPDGVQQQPPRQLRPPRRLHGERPAAVQRLRHGRRRRHEAAHARLRRQPPPLQPRRRRRALARHVGHGPEAVRRARFVRPLRHMHVQPRPDVLLPRRLCASRRERLEQGMPAHVRRHVRRGRRVRRDAAHRLLGLRPQLHRRDLV
uniref:OSIGBa0147J19.6 protein n=1 Tax=Oryza sativa TaxID=4530 RepID=Q01KM3_ORYSA|nr:OSIGBa0147J19.6 [Oryza sativa]